jgi:hypothetical protein
VAVVVFGACCQGRPHCLGIGETRDHTLEEAVRTSISPASASAGFSANALRKLRHPSRSKRLKAFVENSFAPVYCGTILG